MLMRPNSMRPYHQFSRTIKPSNLLGHHIQQMNRRHPLPQILLKASRQYLPYLLIGSTIDLPIHKIVTHLKIGQILIGSIPRQHLEKNDPNPPDIALGRIDVFSIDLRTHVGRRPHVVEFRRFLGLVDEITETEVCDSGASTGQKNVGRLHIAMYDLLLLDRHIPLHDVPRDMQRLDLGQLAVALDVLLQIALLAEFRHDVNVMLGHEDFDGADDVGVGQGTERVDFIVEQVLLHCVFDLGQLDHLDGDDFVGGLVVATVDQRAESLPDRRGMVVDVVLYFLEHLLLLLLHDSIHHVIHTQLISPTPATLSPI